MEEPQERTSCESFQYSLICSPHLFFRISTAEYVEVDGKPAVDAPLRRFGNRREVELVREGGGGERLLDSRPSIFGSVWLFPFRSTEILFHYILIKWSISKVVKRKIPLYTPKLAP